MKALPEGLRLVVAGRFGHADQARRSRDLAKGGNVTFIEDPDEATLAGLYRAACVFVRASGAPDPAGGPPAAPEFTCRPAMRALASGACVLASDAGCLPEIASGGSFARVFHDDDELVRGLADVLSRAWPPAGAGDLARARATSVFGLDAFGVRLARFYGDVAARRRGAA